MHTSSRYNQRHTKGAISVEHIVNTYIEMYGGPYRWSLGSLLDHCHQEIEQPPIHSGTQYSIYSTQYHSAPCIHSTAMLPVTFMTKTLHKRRLDQCLQAEHSFFSTVFLMVLIKRCCTDAICSYVRMVQNIALPATTEACRAKQTSVQETMAL